MPRLLLALCFCLLAGAPSLSGAATSVFAFDDPEHERRFAELSARLRCPKCLNTNLEGSDAPIAQDLKREIHRQIKSGRSDAEILDFMRARYGDFILYEPRLTAATWLLWFGPLLMLLAGLGILWWRLSSGNSGDGGSTSSDGDSGDGDSGAGDSAGTNSGAAP